jgi:hypothetical protein
LISVGEIDCRENEGILKNIKKGIYLDIDIAVDSTFAILKKEFLNLNINYKVLSIWPDAAKKI